MREPMPGHQVEVFVEATPEAVWAIVSDVARMGEWSPECRKVVVWGRKPVHLGSWMSGFNRRGWIAWPTLSSVHVYDEGRSIGWHTRDSGARWIFEVEPAEGGTIVRERREVPHGMPVLSRFLAEHLLGGVDAHADELHAGMQTTLDRIKAEAETATPGH